MPEGLAWDAVKVTAGRPMSKGRSSHFGGTAALPADMVWPRHGGRPLDLLFTLECQDLRDFQTNLDLPHEGILLFFYDLEAEPWGWAGEEDGWRVIYLPAGPADGVAAAAPRPLPALTAAFQQIRTYPDCFSPWLEQTGLTLDERYDLSESYADEMNAGAQIGGHASPIQNAMEVDCELSLLGVELAPEVYSSPIGQEAQTKVFEWRLLLQLSSEDRLGMVFADYGSLYFWIKLGDLARRDFSRVRLVLQTT